ncbi:30S ribosomal protein S20 [Candidatus Neomarinimicrobiota bacterium]
MDRHPSAIKRHRQSLKRREKNRIERSTVRTFIKKVETATTKEVADEALRVAISALDKSAQDNIFHPNKAARLKSKITKKVNSRFASK